jgi:glucose repression mediator protein
MSKYGCRLVRGTGYADADVYFTNNRTIGNVAELMGQLDDAMAAYEHALRANPRSIPAMNAISSILRAQEHFQRAVEYLQNILKLDQNNGDVWGSLGG